MRNGHISYSNGQWVIACPGHIRTRLRRLFPQVDQRAGELITLSNNNENCRELLWFLDRYPMTVDRLDLLQKSADAYIERQALIFDLLENRRPPERFELAEPARDYQAEGATLLEIRRSLLIADDVGLGKTVTAICPMVNPVNLPALVVTFTHLPRQWELSINRFAPHLKTHIVKTGKPYDLSAQKRKRGSKDQQSLFDEPRLPDVIIMSYSKLHGWAETLSGLIRYIVFDEIQDLRRHESLKYAAAKHIAGKALLRAGLSATPIYGYGFELYNVISVLDEDVLGTRAEFANEWCNNDKLINDPVACGEYLRSEGIMIRRTRADVGRELPPLSKIPQMIEADVSALDRIKGSAIELAKTILAHNQRFQGEKFQASERFSNLMRQATGVAKAPYVAEFVRMLLDSGDKNEKLVLFGWHREVYGIWLEALAEYKPMLYTGSESPTQKELAAKAFCEGDSRILIMSLRAGTGLDGLQHVCKTIVYGELDYSPGVHEQNDGRVGRDGQLHPVMSYYLMASYGSDPVLADILGVKNGQIQGIRDPGGALIEKLEVTPGMTKRIAEAYLAQMGVKVDPLPAHDAEEVA